MNAATITASTFTLTPQGGAAVSCTVSYNATGSVATLTPSASLSNNTLYTATITTGAQDSTGVALASNYSWTFTTAAAPPAPPTVTAVTPANSSTGVAVATNPTATFSQAMTASTITSSTFTLTGPGGTAVSGNASYDAPTSIATFQPLANLAYNTQYTGTITTGVQNSSSVSLASNYTWSFTTAPGPVPAVSATVPAGSATSVSVTNALTATFTQPMTLSTINTTNFTLTATGGSAVTGTVTYTSSSKTATFTPSAALAYNTSYTATITTGVTDTASAALAANYVWTFATGANPNQATVDFGAQKQFIRGFGGSTAWLGQMTQAQANALFDPINGLGLSILRVRIDYTGSAASTPYPWATTSPSDGGNWLQEATNGKEAAAANPKAIVFASPWTQPTSMKTSSSSQPYNNTCASAGACGGYLDQTNHGADYANYLEDFVKYFNATAGLNLYAISMQNEPDWNTSYESCVWTPAQMDAWIANYASVITGDAYSTKFIMPESLNFNPVQAAIALSDPNAENRISIIGGHLYGVSPAPYTIPSGDSPKELWMTEHGPDSSQVQATYALAMTYAEEVHNSMVTGQYNAYVWWGIFGLPTSAGSYGLIASSATNPGRTVFGNAIGQFSKFVQPGYYRYNATANPSSNVFISAYAGIQGGQQHDVIVAINGGASAVSQSFTIQNGTVTSMTPYQTTSTAGLAPLSAVTVSGGQFTYSLPAQSITTFVQ